MQVASGFRAHWLCATLGKRLIKNSLMRRSSSCSHLAHLILNSNTCMEIWPLGLALENRTRRVLYLRCQARNTIKFISVWLEFDTVSEGLNQLSWLLFWEYKQMCCIFTSILIIALTDHLLVSMQAICHSSQSRWIRTYLFILIIY